MAKGFLSTLTALDAQRLQKSVKATVQASGRLTFAMDAVNDMHLSEDKSIIILESNDGSTLGAAISTKGDPKAFALKKCGAYFYVTFKNYLQQNNIDYKSQRIIYDITELDEKYEGKTLYKFERRILPRGASDDEIAEETQAAEPASASEAPESPSAPADEAGATGNAPETENAGSGVLAPHDEADTDSGSTPPTDATADTSAEAS